MGSKLIWRRALVTACSAAIASAFVNISPPIEGIVIDAETLRPVKGASLLIGWPGFGMHGAGPITQGVRAVVADSNGHFAVGPSIFIGLGPGGFKNAKIGVAAMGYVADTLTTYSVDPYIQVESKWWGARALSIKMESQEFNRLSLLRLVKDKPGAIRELPEYLPNGVYYTPQRVSGLRPIDHPNHYFIGPESNKDSESKIFWCKVRSGKSLASSQQTSLDCKA